jgi:hypothetical protein
MLCKINVGMKFLGWYVDSNGIKHNNFVKYTYLISINKMPILVMEYLNGITERDGANPTLVLTIKALAKSPQNQLKISSQFNNLPNEDINLS